MLNVLRAVRQGEVVLPPAAAKRILVEFTRRSPLDGSAAPSRQDELTQDELSVLRGLAEAAGHAEIAAALGVSESSVRAHARGILSKLCRRQGADSNAGGGADGGA
jgi:DNA-binding NarL/FixJ family response regulator